MPSAGDLRERVRFEEPAASDDGMGNSVQGWTLRFTRSALYLMQAGSEAMTAERLAGRQPVTIIVRFDPSTSAVTPAWRLVDLRAGTVFAIRAAADMDRRRAWWTMVCEAEVT
ncbi:head-tail adaptor protein [uncultured Enterovirga sp.]|uniref:head-tail adaptor protein n=1 Tax=uncultured Enterovirga sp. TaxID=2026352 RepID=UPI0035CAD12B